MQEEDTLKNIKCLQNHPQINEFDGIYLITFWIDKWNFIPYGQCKQKINQTKRWTAKINAKVIN